MGLGKTIQICSYLKGLFDGDHIKRVLIAVPATMKSYWLGELDKWCYGVDNVMQFEDKKRSEREA
jgi:SNF2 family DNA or RNA helicase